MDSWHISSPLRDLYPSLYTAVKNPLLFVHRADFRHCHRIGWDAFFSTEPDILNHQILRGMLSSILPTLSSSRRDKRVWTDNPSGIFTIKSTYLALHRTKVFPSKRFIFWHPTLLTKVQIFLSIIFHNKRLTTNNFIKRGWLGDPTCVLCKSRQKTGYHLFYR